MLCKYIQQSVEKTIHNKDHPGKLAACPLISWSVVDQLFYQTKALEIYAPQIQCSMQVFLDWIPQNSYSIDLLNKSTEIAKIMFSVQRRKMRWLFQPFTQFQGSPGVVSILLLKDTV